MILSNRTVISTELFRSYAGKPADLLLHVVAGLLETVPTAEYIEITVVDRNAGGNGDDDSDDSEEDDGDGTLPLAGPAHSPPGSGERGFGESGLPGTSKSQGSGAGGRDHQSSVGPS